MGYSKFYTGQVFTNEEGKAKIKTSNDINGEICKIRIIYSIGASPETIIKISTIEGEVMVNLQNNNKEKILYPLHSSFSDNVGDIAISGQDSMQKYISVGPIIIEIDNSNKNGGVIENIIITYKE